MSDSEQEAWQQDEFDGMKAEIAQLREELARYQDGYKGSCYACEVVGERNVSLEAEIAQLRARLREVQEIYTGSDGFIPATAPEAYCLRIMYQMYRAALTEGEGKADG